MKTVVIGVTGCIAAYKTLEVISSLKRLGYSVQVVMTNAATEFVSPLTFETVTHNEVVTNTFSRNSRYEVEHVSLAKKASAFVVCPTTADVIAKLAHGVADDMLTTTAISVPMSVPHIVCPAMNTVMYEAEVTKNNLEILKNNGYIVVEPTVGRLACGDVGKGHLADVDTIVEAIDSACTPDPDLRGKKVLIAMGGTEEPIDPVRVITNHSSGKTGLALIDAVRARGGTPIVVAGTVSVSLPLDVDLTRVRTTMDMLSAVEDRVEDSDIVIMCAAPSDYRVENYSDEKIKSDSLTLRLVKNPDIAARIGEKKGNKKLVVFAAETSDLERNALKKLSSKHADLVVANDVTMKDAGFGTDTNVAVIMDGDGSRFETGLVTKEKLAHLILDKTLYGI